MLGCHRICAVLSPWELSFLRGRSPTPLLSPHSGECYLALSLCGSPSCTAVLRNSAQRILMTFSCRVPSSCISTAFHMQTTHIPKYCTVPGLKHNLVKRPSLANGTLNSMHVAKHLNFGISLGGVKVQKENPPANQTCNIRNLGDTANKKESLLLLDAHESNAARGIWYSSVLTALTPLHRILTCFVEFLIHVKVHATIVT